METTRRGFFGLLLGATAAGTLLTNNAVAKVILQYPEDPISGTIRRAKEMMTLCDLGKAKARQFDVRFHNLPEYDQFLEVSDGLLDYMLDNFTVVPHPDQVRALFEGFLFPRKNARLSYMYEIDALDETLLRSMSQGLIPIWIAKASIQVYKMPWNTLRMKAFDRFADHYRGLIMNGVVSEEFKNRVAAIHMTRDEETEMRLRRELSEWLTTRHLTKSALIV